MVRGDQYYCFPDIFLRSCLHLFDTRETEAVQLSRLEMFDNIEPGVIVLLKKNWFLKK